MTAGAGTLEGPRPRLTGRAAFLLVVVTILAVFSMVPLREYLGGRSRVAELQRQALLLEDANAKLRADIVKLHDPVELERLARACLGLVKPGEIAFVTTPKPGDPEPSNC